MPYNKCGSWQMVRYHHHAPNFMSQVANRLTGLIPSKEPEYTIEIFEYGQWFRCPMITSDFSFALEHASERANEIGEERVRILLDGKPIT